MAAGDFLKKVGKQRAVWAQPGGTVWVKNIAQHFEALVIEAATAVRDPLIMLDDTLVHSSLSIPIMVLPAGVNVLKTVAMVAPASIKWDDDAGSATWAVDDVKVIENTSTRQLSLIADLGEAGKATGLERVAYHITLFIQGRKYIADPTKIEELEGA